MKTKKQLEEDLLLHTKLMQEMEKFEGHEDWQAYIFQQGFTSALRYMLEPSVEEQLEKIGWR